MADDADKSADLADRLAAPRAPAERATYFECFKRQTPRPRKVVLAAFVDRWIALGWVAVAHHVAGGERVKVTIEWLGGGEPATPGSGR